MLDKNDLKEKEACVKTERIRIDLANKANAEKKVRHEVWTQKKPVLKKGQPDDRKFHAIPKFNPQLREYIRTVEWNSTKKELYLVVEETSTFATYEWIINMNDRRDELSKSPFSDLEQDALALVFMDLQDKEVARIKMKGLQLKDHSSTMIADNNIEGLNPLLYNVTLTYDSLERLPTHEGEEKLEFKNPNEVVDEEWIQSE